MAFAEWVIAPAEIRSTPVWATRCRFSKVIFPDASVSGLRLTLEGFQVLTIFTASSSCAMFILSNKIISTPALRASATSSSVRVSTSTKIPFLFFVVMQLPPFQ